jgi:hypothetical protein
MNATAPRDGSRGPAVTEVTAVTEATAVTEVTAVTKATVTQATAVTEVTAVTEARCGYWAGGGSVWRPWGSGVTA